MVPEGPVNDALLDRYRADGVPVRLLYEPQEVCAVLGASRKAEKDLLLGALRADGVPVRSRRGGGGTVILSPGQAVLALVAEADRPFENREYAARIGGWIAEALARLGVRGVAAEGISDLAVEGRKILGASIYRSRRILFYQASLLVSNDLALFGKYLAFPDRVPEYRAGRGHEEFCTTLVREGYPLTVAAVMDALRGVVDAELPRFR
jgi:lipoate---protein ligase